MAGKPWKDDARKKWSERQRTRNEAFTKRVDPSRSGAPDLNDRDRGRAVGGDVHDRNGRDKNNDGGNLLSGTANNSKKESIAEKPLIDLPAFKAGLPGQLIDYNELWDDVIQGITSHKWFRKLYFVKELTLEKAKAKAELLWPMVERMVPKFLEKHPILCGLGVIVLDPILRIRSKEKQKGEAASGTSSKEEGKKD